MKRTILWALAILVLASVAGAQLESPQKAVQPLWLREVHFNRNVDWTVATYCMTFIFSTDKMDLITFTASRPCSVRIFNSGTPAAPSGFIFLPLATVTDFAISDPDSMWVWRTGGTGALYAVVYGQKR